MWRFLGFVLMLALVVGGFMYYTNAWPFNLLAHESGNSQERVNTGNTNKVTGKLIPGSDEGNRGSSGPESFPDAGRGPLLGSIVVHDAAINLIDDLEISSRFDGQIDAILVELETKVVRGQLLLQLDDSLIRTQEEAAFMKAESEIGIKAAQAKYDASKAIYESDILAKSGVSENEKMIHRFQRDQALYEWNKAIEDREIAKKELAKVRRERELHRIISPINGWITQVNRKKGESVRPGEPLFKISNYERFRLEGAIPIQQALNVRPGMKALVHPENRRAPLKELRGHTAMITGLAMAPDGMLLVSSSEDHRLILWDWKKGFKVEELQAEKSGPLHAVAAGPVSLDAKSKQRTYQFLTGGGEGRAQLWFITFYEWGQLKSKKAIDLKVEHKSAIHSVALSADGKYCATGGEDRQILVWAIKNDTVELLYKVQELDNFTDTAHRGAISTLQFTPDGSLISAASDRTIKKWKLGKEAAELTSKLEQRLGDVYRVGITPDGQRVLFDFGDDLRVMDINDKSILGTIHSHGQGNFKELALFSPTGQLVLTQSANGRLQMWTVPTPPKIADELRQLYAGGLRRDTAFLFGSVLGPTSVSLGFGSTSQALTSAWTSTLTDAGAAKPSAAAPANPLALPGIVAPPTEQKPVARASQLWNLSSFEIRHFITPDLSAVRSGAFTPQQSMIQIVEQTDGEPVIRRVMRPIAMRDAVVCTGGDDRVIRVWQMPSEEEIVEPLEAVVTAVGGKAESGTGLVRVRAELDHPGDRIWRLMPGNRVDLTIYPETLVK